MTQCFDWVNSSILICNLDALDQTSCYLACLFYSASLRNVHTQYVCLHKAVCLCFEKSVMTAMVSLAQCNVIVHKTSVITSTSHLLLSWVTLHKGLMIYCCSGYAEAVTGGGFEGGSGVIWLDNVACRGDEDDIEDCVHAGWAKHNCAHLEDAGVRCGLSMNSTQTTTTVSTTVSTVTDTGKFNHNIKCTRINGGFSRFYWRECQSTGRS